MRKLFAGKVKSFARDEKGASMVEYAVLVGVIAAVSIAVVTAIGGTVGDAFRTTETRLTTNAVNAAPAK